MRTIRLRTDRDLRTFAERYEEVGGFPLPLGYLRRSQVMGCFRGDRMVGGYVVNESDRLRALEDMPGDEAERIMARYADRSPWELMCLWTEPQLRRTTTGTLVWLRALSEALRRPGRPLLLCTVQPGLLRMYLKGDPVRLYDGTIDLPDGTVLGKHVLAIEDWTPVIRTVVREAAARCIPMSPRTV